MLKLVSAPFVIVCMYVTKFYFVVSFLTSSIITLLWLTREAADL